MNSFLHRRHSPGVTLIEAIMVIALLATAAATSLILMDSQWIARREVTMVTNEVADCLGTARSTAIANQATLRVRRVRVSGIEQLQITEAAGPFRAGKTWQVELGSDVRMSGTPQEIRFAPTGTANRNLEWTITSSQSAGQVTVAAANGQVARQLP